MTLDSGLSRDASDTGHTESEVCSTSSEDLAAKDSENCNRTNVKSNNIDHHKIDTPTNQISSVGYTQLYSSGIEKSDEDSLGAKTAIPPKIKTSPKLQPQIPAIYRSKTFTLEGNYSEKTKSSDSPPSFLTDDDKTAAAPSGSSSSKSQNTPSPSSNRRRLSNFYKPDMEITLLTIKPKCDDTGGKYSSDDQKHLENATPIKNHDSFSKNFKMLDHVQYRSRSPTRRNKKSK